MRWWKWTDVYLREDSSGARGPECNFEGFLMTLKVFLRFNLKFKDFIVHCPFWGYITFHYLWRVEEPLNFKILLWWLSSNSKQKSIYFALIYSLSLGGGSACQFRANVCHKDIRSSMITCSSNIEGFLKTLKGFLKTLKLS